MIIRNCFQTISSYLLKFTKTNWNRLGEHYKTSTARFQVFQIDPERVLSANLIPVQMIVMFLSTTLVFANQDSVSENDNCN